MIHESEKYCLNKSKKIKLGNFIANLVMTFYLCFFTPFVFAIIHFVYTLTKPFAQKSCKYDLDLDLLQFSTIFVRDDHAFYLPLMFMIEVIIITKKILKIC